jgi:type I restriction enzyme S subunit
LIAWPVVSLADVASPEKRAIISGPFGSNIGKRFFVPYGVPVIRGNNLANPDLKFSDDGFVYITEEKAATLNCWAYPDDLIFTAAGSLGQVGVIPKNGRHPRYTISNKQLRIRLDKTKIVLTGPRKRIHP